MQTRGVKSATNVRDVCKGIEVAKHADDLCLVNSMHGDSPAHPQASIQLHTGNIQFVRPSIGSWVCYGLGSQNANLPGFITINPPSGVGGAQLYGAAFLPAAFEGTRLGGGSSTAISNISNPRYTQQQQRRQIDLVQQMNKDMLRRSGGYARPSTPDMTLNVTPESPTPISTPHVRTSPNVVDECAIVTRPRTYSSVPPSTTFAVPKRSAIMPAKGCIAPQTRFCTAIASANDSRPR